MARLHAEERRAQLLAAAREEFLSVGPDGARINKIAERAGVNVALLYRFFESKEQMFDEAVIEPLDTMLTELLVEISQEESNTDVQGTVEKFYRSLLQIFTETFELFSIVLFTDRASGHDFYQNRIAPFVDNLADQIRKAGDLWPQRFDPATTVPMSVGMCWGVVMDAHFRGNDLDTGRMAMQLSEITFRGLLGEPTRG